QENGLPQKVRATFEPERGYDVGAGKGSKVTTELHGGVVGIILDGRGRPFELSSLNEEERVNYLTQWIKEMNIYPEGDWSKAK
ncbi:MAG: hypothetical protein JXA92_13775, partial [candidate division Zixibacteria bacterium]|nr:hypothetical protein [candidate division Zixibacteria bacterium]